MTELGPRPGHPFRAQHVAQYSRAGCLLTMLTAYDVMTARIIDAAGVDMILVGDFYGTTMLGMDSAVGMILDDMVRATGTVTCGTKCALVAGDLSFGIYESSRAQVVGSAVALVRTGTTTVKLEGGRRMAAQVKAIVDAGINVMGYLGFTSQPEDQLGSKRMQGRGDVTREILESTLTLREAGVFAIVFEMMPASIAAMAAKELNIPIVGTGAGPAAAEQVLVWCNMAGMQDWKPSFAYQLGNVGAELSRAAPAYRNVMVNGTFPITENFRQDRYVSMRCPLGWKHHSQKWGHLNSQNY